MLFVLEDKDEILGAAFIIVVVDIAAVVAPQISVDDGDDLAIVLESFIQDSSSDCQQPHERQLM